MLLLFIWCLTLKAWGELLSVECVGVRPNHHDNFLQWIWAPSKFSPVDAILVSTSVVSTSVPHTVKVGVCTCIVPPSTFLVMSTVTCNRREELLCKEAVRIILANTALYVHLFGFLCIFKYIMFYMVYGKTLFLCSSIIHKDDMGLYWVQKWTSTRCMMMEYPFGWHCYIRTHICSER